MEDKDVLKHIGELVAEEGRLRDELDRSAPDSERQKRLKAVEVSLDQCWDLLRQRRGRRHAGADPDDSAARPPEVVERYQQ
jgi:hypothetical protein